MTPNEQLERLAHELLLFLQESAEYQTDLRVRQRFFVAGQTAATIGRRLQLARDRCVVAIVGQSNVGKSTLVNALLGIDLAPRRNGPCTAIPVEFVYARGAKLVVKYRGLFDQRHIPCRGIAQLRQELYELADDASDQAGQQLEKVVVELPHRLLQRGLVLADTPGFGAVQLDTAAGDHEQALREYLVNNVAQLYWVTLAEQSIGNRELQFYQLQLADLCRDLVVTGCDDWSDADQARFHRKHVKLFGHTPPMFHFVSGKEGNGIAQLRKHMYSAGRPEGRFTAAMEALERLAHSVRAWIQEYRDERDRPLSPAWRPDSWLRLQQAPESQDARQRILKVLDLNNYP